MEALPLILRVSSHNWPNCDVLASGLVQNWSVRQKCCKFRTFLKFCPIRFQCQSKMSFKNVLNVLASKNYPNIYHYSLHLKSAPCTTNVPRLSLMYIQREVHITISFNDLCSISLQGRKMRETVCNLWPLKKLSKKMRMTDRSLNQTRTFLEVRNVFGSYLHLQTLERYAFNLHWASCSVRFGGCKHEQAQVNLKTDSTCVN